MGTEAPAHEAEWGLDAPAAAALLAQVREADGSLFRCEAVAQLYYAVKEVVLESLHGLWAASMDGCPAARALAGGGLLTPLATQQLLLHEPAFRAALEQYHQGLQQCYVGEQRVDGDVVMYEGWAAEVAESEMACLTHNGARDRPLRTALGFVVAALLQAHYAQVCALPTMAARGIAYAVPHAAEPSLDDLLRGVFARVGRAALVVSGALFCPWVTSVHDVDLLLREAFRRSLLEDCVAVAAVDYCAADGRVVVSDAVAPSPVALATLLVTRQLSDPPLVPLPEEAPRSPRTPTGGARASGAAAAMSRRPSSAPLSPTAARPRPPPTSPRGAAQAPRTSRVPSRPPSVLRNGVSSPLPDVGPSDSATAALASRVTAAPPRTAAVPAAPSSQAASPPPPRDIADTIALLLGQHAAAVAPLTRQPSVKTSAPPPQPPQPPPPGTRSPLPLEQQLQLLQQQVLQQQQQQQQHMAQTDARLAPAGGDATVDDDDGVVVVPRARSVHGRRPAPHVM